MKSVAAIAELGFSVFVIVGCFTFAPEARCQGSGWVHDRLASGDFRLVGAQAADIVVSADDFRVVQIAAENLSQDVERVSGKKPAVLDSASRVSPHAVI